MSRHRYGDHVARRLRAVRLSPPGGHQQVASPFHVLAELLPACFRDRIGRVATSPGPSDVHLHDARDRIADPAIKALPLIQGLEHVVFLLHLPQVGRQVVSRRYDVTPVLRGRAFFRRPNDPAFDKPGKMLGQQLAVCAADARLHK